MQKVLIFGIAGFVGHYLAQEFLNNGYTVCGSDIVKYDRLQVKVEYHKVDLLNAMAVAELVNIVRPNIIVNLAAISSVGASWNMPQATMSVNVIGALNIMEAVRKSENTQKIMFIGSSEEYKVNVVPISEKMPLNANNPYGISKMAQARFAEIYRERYGMKIYCTRPFNHTGVGQKVSFALPSFCKQVAEIEKSGKSGSIKVGNLSAERDFSDVRDIVRAYRMIIESADCTKIYNVGSGNAYRLKEMLEYIVSLSSQKIHVVVDPEQLRPVDTPRICCDYSYIKAELGWSPKYSIFETLKSMYEFFVNA